MKDANPNTIYLKDYTQPPYWITNIDLVFDLEEEQTLVTSTLSVSKNESISGEHPLVLQGEELGLESISVDGRVLDASEYEVTDTDLTIHSVPDVFTLEIKTIIKPQENTSLEGLYKSSGNFCTQCEAEGFRKITYFLDRPDVMAIFSTTIIANKEKYPVLLSNGNPVATGEYDNGWHWARWEDPFKKPCYLFALVAGDLAFIEDKFTTMSGRDVDLRIYVQHHNIDQCDHAMRSLVKSMQWDEQVYGREYDLDVYNIVAVDDFNMGAMENKGLNVFNSKYVLAKKETATDVDFINIEAVIGHEYFHNWSGNRVTCRDWFQLTLKEGLTVFRDQCFTADMNAETTKRIDDVNVLRTAQFAEDAGPMAHPIQPDAYLEINNFYTVTVYNKGAEVIRMIHTILGEDGFRKGMDLYFDRHDGQAVTTEDFIDAMEAANDIELTQFRRWYKQSGTPEISVQESYDEAAQRYALTLKQTTPATPEQESKSAFDIPVRVGLLSGSGDDMEVIYEGTNSTSHTLRLIEDEQCFVFEDVKEKPVLSMLRDFSAPIKIKFDRSDEELAFCVANDSDGFNRWDAGQQLAIRIILNMVNGNQDQSIPDYLVSAYQTTLQNKSLDRALSARALALPSQAYISEMMKVVDVDAIHDSQKFMEKTLGAKLFDEWLAVYQQCESVEYDLSPASMGARALKSTALSYMVASGNEQGEALALQQFEQASNMTDQLAAFRVLVHHACGSRDRVIEAFYQQWQHDQLVMDKWFMIQATAPQADTLERVEQLFEHDDFDLKNPNRVRSLLGAFCSGNPICFHATSGEGYRLLGHYIEQLNDLNPQIASRLTTPLTRWKRFDEQRQAHMTTELARLKQLPQLSRDVYELVEKSLN
ncbi:MAG: aminopeptidase N [Gammaproteobacteria bacterium]|nr:aminopeptidase N [Gammaproteobacteria bacterium]